MIKDFNEKHDWDHYKSDSLSGIMPLRAKACIIFKNSWPRSISLSHKFILLEHSALRIMQQVSEFHGQVFTDWSTKIWQFFFTQSIKCCQWSDEISCWNYQSFVSLMSEVYSYNFYPQVDLHSFPKTLNIHQFMIYAIICARFNNFSHWTCFLFLHSILLLTCKMLSIQVSDHWNLQIRRATSILWLILQYQNQNREI